MAASEVENGTSRAAQGGEGAGAGPASEGKTKEALAQAGRRKLEEFRAKRKPGGSKDTKGAAPTKAASPAAAKPTVAAAASAAANGKALSNGPINGRPVKQEASEAINTIKPDAIAEAVKDSAAGLLPQTGGSVQISTTGLPIANQPPSSGNSALASVPGVISNGPLKPPSLPPPSQPPPSLPAAPAPVKTASDERTRRKLAFPETSSPLVSAPSPPALLSRPQEPPPAKPPTLLPASAPIPPFYPAAQPRAPPPFTIPSLSSSLAPPLPSRPDLSSSIALPKAPPPITTSVSMKPSPSALSQPVVTKPASQNPPSLTPNQDSKPTNSIKATFSPPSAFSPPPPPTFMKRASYPEQTVKQTVTPIVRTVLQPLPASLPPPPPRLSASATPTFPPARPSTASESFSLDDLLSGTSRQPPAPTPAAVSSPRKMSTGSVSAPVAARARQVEEAREAGQMPPPLPAAPPPPVAGFPGGGLSRAGSLQPPPLSPSSSLRPSSTQDFSSLEQHIADLTAEKYTLQRGLDTTRALAESLEQENSRLTEDFNKQGGVINQLQGELERQRGEIQAQQLVLKAMNEERDRWQRDNASAKEQAQVMGREVVQLEEQVLRLRSRELKVEKEVSEMRPELDQTRRQLAAISADRTSLRRIIEDLQEERRMLLSRLRRAGVLADLDDIRAEARAERERRVDAATDTADLGPSGEAPPPPATAAMAPPAHSPAAQRVAAAVAAAMQTPPDRRMLPPGERTVIPAGIPEEQARIIESINNLVDDLAAERLALLATLSAETRAGGELRAANAELSRKLAVVTQRLELAVAQAMTQSETAGTMASPGRAISAYVAPSPPMMQEDGPYMDEGDEVVERVLGWLSRLFAGKAKPRQHLQRAATVS